MKKMNALFASLVFTTQILSSVGASASDICSDICKGADLVEYRVSGSAFCRTPGACEEITCVKVRTIKDSPKCSTVTLSQRIPPHLHEGACTVDEIEEGHVTRRYCTGHPLAGRECFNYCAPS